MLPKTKEEQDASDCGANMMAGLRYLFEQAYQQGREQGRQDQFRDVAEKVETPTNGSQSFPDELVEKLAEVAFDAGRKDVVGVGGFDRGRWKFATEDHKQHRRMEIRAELSELAKAPVDVPTEEELYVLWAKDPAWPKAIRARVAPVLAAKDAQLEAQTKRIAELEAFAVENRKMQIRIAELEKQHVYQMQRAAEASAKLLMREAEALPIVVDGKTPGQVSRDARRMATLARALPFYETEIYDGNPVDNDTIENYAAREVLRLFGVEALLQKAAERVRENGRSVFHGDKSGIDAIEYAAALVDQIAKLEEK